MKDEDYIYALQSFNCDEFNMSQFVFNEWFDSLSEEEQREYFEDLEAEYWNNEAKNMGPVV